jgi:CMP-N,N'-diacetyllegionaminic acid synthase
MRVLGIIPARGGSKGVPRKNIRDLAGKPLLAWTIEAAKGSRLSRVILSTDDQEIADVGRKYGADVPFIRPLEHATDSARAIPMLQHAVKALEDQGDRYDAVMMLQPTSPMRLPRDIDGALEKLGKDPEATSVISVVPVGEFHPARMKYLDGDLLVDPPFCEAYENQPRQELTPMYIRSGSIYLVRRRILMETGSLKGTRCLAQVMPKHRSVNIDSPFDFEQAEWLLAKPDWREWR